MKEAPVILDCLGGDEGLADNVDAVAELIHNDRGRIPLLLVGPKEAIIQGLEDHKITQIPSSISFEDCSLSFEMGRPAQDILKEKGTSLYRALVLMKEGRGAAVVSAGHTGAVFMGAVSVLGRLEGVLRPALGIVFPTIKGPTMLLDVGANVDCKPVHLFQFAVMGACYYTQAFQQREVTVGLFNIGEEASKGNRLVREAYELMAQLKDIPDISFEGMMDASQLFHHAPHVLVADGFVGNALVKATESLVERFGYEFKKILPKSNLLTKVGFFLSKHVWRSLKKGLDFRDIGGAPLLGLKGNVFVCHGRSDGPTIAQCIRRTRGIDMEAYQASLLKALSLIKQG